MKKGWFAWILYNIAVVICFTALAIYFNHWWIALFSALFIASAKYRDNEEKNDDGGRK